MRDKCRLIPYVSGAEFLQSPSGLTCSPSFLHRYQLQLIKDATLYFGRQFVLIEQDVWKHSPSERRYFLTWPTWQVKSLRDHSNAASRHISSARFSRWSSGKMVEAPPRLFCMLPEASSVEARQQEISQHGRLSSGCQRAQYSKYGTPAVWRAAESQEEAFHLIGGKTKTAAISGAPAHHTQKKKKPNKKRGMFPYQKKLHRLKNVED